jgi:hypothetical protein
VKLVLYVDPRRRIVDAYGDNGYRATISAREVYTPPSFPDLTLDLPAMFAELNITKRNR